MDKPKKENELVVRGQTSLQIHGDLIARGLRDIAALSESSGRAIAPTPPKDIYEAICENDVAAVQSILDADPTLASVSDGKTTPVRLVIGFALWLETRWGVFKDSEPFESLVERRDGESEDEFGQRVIEAASDQHDSEEADFVAILRLLLEHGADATDGLDWLYFTQQGIWDYFGDFFNFEDAELALESKAAVWEEITNILNTYAQIIRRPNCSGFRVADPLADFEIMASKDTDYAFRIFVDKPISSSVRKQCPNP